MTLLPETSGETFESSSDSEDSLDVSAQKLDLESDEDGDTCADEELQRVFNVPYHLQTEQAVALEKTYILSLDGTRSSEANIVAAFSDNTCGVYNLSYLSKVSTLHGHKATITGVRFSPKNESLIYTSSLDGTLKLWDLRKNAECVKEYNDSTEGSPKPLTSFDTAPSDRFLCAGTELIEEDSFLLFWDVRSSSLLGGYWESHEDDVTQVCFHPSVADLMATGSTDGLINVFDIGKEKEGDALLHCLNSESSVGKLRWFSQEGKDRSLSCITHTEDLQLWRIEDGAPFLTFSRDKVAESLQRKQADNCYLVDVHHTTESDKLMVLAGSNSKNGECLRTLQVEKKKLLPSSVLPGNKQIVRTSWFNDENELLVTGGESGILSLWKPGKSEAPSLDMKAKSSKKLRKHKSKPF